MSEANICIELHGQFGYQCVRIHPMQVLGTGSYARVVKATLDHLPCAAKFLHPEFFMSDDPGQEDSAARFDLECRLLRNLKHPGIVNFLGLVPHPHNRRPILLMELMEESLTSFLEKSSTPLPYYIQVNITHDITQALAYLHTNRVIHRDLSSNNVLVNADNRAKVTDFGMSKLLSVNPPPPRMARRRLTQCPGTPAFMPPEALRARPCYSDKLDIFSTGVLIIQIITRKFPSPTDATMTRDDPTTSKGKKIVLVPELERRKGDISEIPSSHPLLPTVHYCLKDRDKERLSASEICQTLAKLKEAPDYLKSTKESHQEQTTLPQKILEAGQKNQNLGQQMKVKKDKNSAEEMQVQPLDVHETYSLHSTSCNLLHCIFCVSQNTQGEIALYQAAQSGDVDAVRRLIAAQINVNSAQVGYTLSGSLELSYCVFVCM